MRFSTLFISSAFVLASMSVALPIERESMLVARFSYSDFLAEVEARAYDELYAWGRNEHHRGHNPRFDDDAPHTPGIYHPPSQRTASTNEPPLHRRPHAFNGNGSPGRR